MLAFPFDSNVTITENPITHEPETSFDRAISSQPMRHLIKHLFTTGIMPDLSDNYLVSAGSDGMTVSVHSGFAVLEGGLALENEDRILEVTAAHTSLDRIDTVVLRWNENVDVRTCDLYIKAGTPASSPVRPELQRDNSIYEIGLADIFITRSVATITNEKITDTRYETGRCGVVSSVSEFDTTFIYQQVQADLAEFKSDEEADFLAWFESIQDILDTNVAGHLQNEVDTLAGNFAPIETNASSSSRAYAVGKHLVLNNVYYEVTATIAIGDALTVGTNIKIATASDEIETLEANTPWYGSCSTGASTTAKVVTTSDGEFTLKAGAKVKVLMSNSNSATTPTLNVDGTGAKTIYAYGTTKPTVWWKAGDVVEFTYNGSAWIMGATCGQINQLKSDLSDVSEWTAIASITSFTDTIFNSGNIQYTINTKTKMANVEVAVGNTTPSFSGWFTMATLSSAKPRITQYGKMPVSDQNPLRDYRIDTNGKVQIFLWNGDSINYTAFSMTYPIQ